MALVPNSTVLPAVDWRNFYKEVSVGGAIPFRPLSIVTPRSAVVSDLFVTMSDILEKAAKPLQSGGLVTVYADVFRCDADPHLTLLGGGLSVIARRIELNSAVSIDVKGASSTGLFLVAQSCSNPLVITVTDKDDTKPYDLTPNQSLGRGLEVTGGVVKKTRDISALQSSFDWDTPLRRTLTAILQYGTACFDSNSTVARDMFTFVYRATCGVDTATDLRAQSAALLAALAARINSVPFVPYLSASLYQMEAAAYSDAAIAYESQYRVYANNASDATARADAANLMKAHYSDTAGFNKALLDQAQCNYDNATRAVVSAGFATTLQQSHVDTAASRFRTKAEIWAEHQKIKAAFEIIMSVGQVIGAVAVGAVGDGAAAPAAAEAGERAVNTAQKAAKEAGGTYEKLAENLLSIKSVSDLISTTSESLPKIIAAAQSAQDASALAAIDLPTTETASGDADWDAFIVDFTSAMEPAISAGIDGAQKYLDAVQKLAIYSKAALAAQSALIQAGQEVLRLTLQQKLDKADQARVTDYLARQKDDAAAAAALGDIFFSRMLSMRLWLFLAVDAYASAYRYWALRKSGVKPSMISPVAQLKDDLASITRDFEAAYSGFSPPPQDMTNLTLKITADDPGWSDVVKLMRDERSTVIDISLAEKLFAGFGRVRLTTMRVWLEGFATTDPVTVDIASSGLFQDRLRGKIFTFTAPQAQRSFRYQGPVKLDSSIQVDGRIAQGIKDFIFEPTPFTQWHLSVDNALDLSSLTAITLVFFGTAIRDKGM